MRGGKKIAPPLIRTIPNTITMKLEKNIEVRWADCDMNRHVRHSAYYDYGAHIRIQLFKQAGYPPSRLEQLGIGPILFKEECSFIKEIHADDTITINLLKGEVSPDAARWTLHHELFNIKGEKCAHITIKGAWMDLYQRKLVTPPAELAEKFQGLPQGEEYMHRSSAK